MGSIVTVTDPAGSYDLVDLAEVKEELGISGSASDGKLERWISEESSRIADYCSRVFLQETVSEAFRLDVCADQLRLSRVPIDTIASVTEGGTELIAADYEFDAEAGRLYRLSGDTRTSWSAGKIVVVYDGGYAAGAIPAAVQAACLTLIKHRWSAQSRDPSLRSFTIDGVGQKQFWVGGTGEVGDLPPEVAAALDRYREVWV